MINHKFCPFDLQKLIFLKKHDYRNKINSFLLLENVVCVLSERQEVPLSYLPWFCMVGEAGAHTYSQTTLSISSSNKLNKFPTRYVMIDYTFYYKRNSNFIFLRRGVRDWSFNLGCWLGTLLKNIELYKTKELKTNWYFVVIKFNFCIKYVEWNPASYKHWHYNTIYKAISNANPNCCVYKYPSWI